MIKNLGGVFGRNPTFNNVEVEGDLTVDGNYVVAGLNLTINNAIPAGYSVAVGADVMTYLMLAMPNNA